MTGGWYVSGAFLFYGGAAWLAFDVHQQDFFRTLGMTARLSLGLAYVAVLAWLSASWLFVAAPMEVHPESQVPTYGAGSTLNGIEWQPYYSQLNFTLKNPGTDNYDNVLLDVSTDLIIEQLRQTAGLSKCSISTASPYSAVIVQHFENGKPVGPAGINGVDVNGRHWSYRVVPLFAGGKMGPPIGTDITWKIRCDKVPSNSHVDFVAALSVLNPVGSPLYGPPKAANWLRVDATFQDSGRPRHLVFSRYLNGSTCAIKRRFDIGCELTDTPVRPSLLGLIWRFPVYACDVSDVNQPYQGQR